MALRQKLREGNPQLQADTGQGDQEGQASTTSAGSGGSVEATVPGEVAPVVSLEKGDIEFWLRVFTVILLWMILQELKRGR